MTDEPIPSTSAQHLKTSRRLLFLSLLILAAVILAPFFVRNLIDFPVYYAAGQSLLDGRVDLYAPDFALGRVMDYRYPPFFLVVLIPLWMLPYSVAAYLWCVSLAASIGGAFVLVSRAFRSPRLSAKNWVVVALCVAQYFVMAMHYGNAHLPATVILFAALYFALERRESLSGALLALAITVKLTPVLLLPYFALKKRWVLLASTGICLVALNAAPAAYFGPKKNIELLRDWYNHVVASQEFHEENGPINLSLKGQLRRYFTAVDYSERVDGDIDYRQVNVASLPRETVDRLWMAFALVVFASVLLLIWWMSRASSSHAEGNQLQSASVNTCALEIALMICLMLFAGPLTSKIYFIAFLWPAACLAGLASTAAGRARRVAMYALALTAVVNSVLPLLPGRSVQRLLLVLGVDFYVNCLLIAALAYSLMYRRRELQQ